ncbi:hypothetical protein P9B03_07050 [Metasolibacillus meyeri]|uniref:Uncharacterized protein n=1 Tax=Metasolibacillus meyeri TaxID=1071052 RepID=A0AAW9NLJ9_9BACL|nr:hypothetical protein [Metasolibacillus meyeri]MEC1178237.1 hypothetical protein [Metasolibacillus meyeri]
MKKLIYAGLTAIMVLAVGAPATFAKENIPVEGTEIKTVEVPLVDVLESSSLYAINQSTTSTLAKDFATSKGQTGKIKSIGQYIDLSKVIPKESNVVSVTIYCPTNVSVTQSKYTSIDNYIVKNSAGSTATVKFQKTNTPTSTNKTTALAGSRADGLWFVQIEGTILMQHTGMDGFTVFGGSKMIVEYN